MQPFIPEINVSDTQKHEESISDIDKTIHERETEMKENTIAPSQRDAELNPNSST